MKKLFLSALALSSMALSGCSSGTSAGSGDMQTVLAQQSYSNASLNGTYSVTFSSGGGILLFQGSSSPYSGIGTIQFNGNGSISGGSISMNASDPSPCQYSTAGTYSIQNTALGTATVNLTLTSTSKTCPATATVPLNLAVAQQGTSVLFIAATPGTVLSGAAIKQ